MSEEENDDWNDDYDNYQTFPPDGGEYLMFWWEDMRPREVLNSIKEAFNRGVVHGRRLEKVEK